MSAALGDRYCFMKTGNEGMDVALEHRGYADGSRCSNDAGLARVWDSEGYGACAAHLEHLTRRKQKGKSR